MSAEPAPLSEEQLVQWVRDAEHAVAHPALFMPETLVMAERVQRLTRLLADATERGKAEGARPWVDEGGLERHVPMGVTVDGQGPTEPETPHHRACWCGDPECSWTKTLAAERAEAREEAARAVGALRTTALSASGAQCVDQTQAIRAARGGDR